MNAWKSAPLMPLCGQCSERELRPTRVFWDLSLLTASGFSSLAVNPLLSVETVAAALVRQRVAGSRNPRCLLALQLLKSSSCAWGPCERDKEPFALPAALIANSFHCLKKSPSQFRIGAGRDVLMARAFQLSAQMCHCGLLRGSRGGVMAAELC